MSAWPRRARRSSSPTATGRWRRSARPQHRQKLGRSAAFARAGLPLPSGHSRRCRRANRSPDTRWSSCWPISTEIGKIAGDLYRQLGRAADLFAESKPPPESLWNQDLGSSRLLVYEVWNRLAARRLTALQLTALQRERAPALLSRINLTEMNEQALSRALMPFPISVRTLDALHLATMEFIRGRGEMVELASYDNRLLTAAAALGIQAVAL